MYSLGIGLAPVISSNSTTEVFGNSPTSLNIGPMGEVFFHPNKKANGLAFNLRVGSADSFYAAPGIYYVSRPRGGICVRSGVCFPLGGGLEPYLPEIAIGFRF